MRKCIYTAVSAVASLTPSVLETPPVSTPPVSTPPVSTPPVSTPTVSTPTVSTPPASISLVLTSERVYLDLLGSTWCCGASQ